MPAVSHCVPFGGGVRAREPPHMANETESAALMERCSGRMDGWAKYYEYFHKLSSDMQVAAQTRARERPDACARQHRVALLTLMCASRASCGLPSS